MDNRMQRAKLNAMTTLLAQLVSTAVGVMIPWIMIAQFGSEAYGATTSIASFLAYISLFEGGIGRVARGALYRPLALGDDEQISCIYLAIKRFFTVIGIAFVGYTLILAIFYYDIADVTVFDRKYVFALVVVIALSKFAEYMWGISNITLLNAHQRQYVVNAVTMLSNILNLAAIAILVAANSGILWVKLASSAVFLLKPLVFTIYIKRHYRIKKTQTRAVLRNKATGIAQHVAYVVQNSTDVLILTVCADLKYVAVYSVYHLITFSLRSIVTSFTGGMEAVFGDMIAKGEHGELKATYQKYKFLLTVLVIAFFGTAAILIVPFVALYTEGASDADYIQPAFAFLLVVAEALNCLIWPCFNLTIAGNKLKESQLGAYGEAIVNIGVSLALVFWNPLLGVAIGSVMAALFKCVFYLTFSGKRILRVGRFRMILNTGIVSMVLCLVSLVGMKIVTYFELSNYFWWTVAGIVTFGLVVGIGALTGLVLYPGAWGTLKQMRHMSSVDTKGDSLMYEQYKGHDIKAYAGYVKNNQDLLTCSSGGIATALSRAVIERGGYVAGVTYSSDFMEAKYDIVNTIEGIERFKGSKYVEVQKGTIYKDVQALLDDGKTVLFFGLPCAVAALRAALKMDYDRLITVDLICHGPTLSQVHKDYITYLTDKYQSNIVEFSVKKKLDAWTPGYLYAKFENGQSFCEQFYHTEYGYGFSVLAKKGCYACPFRGNNRTGDIMIGDFWGANPEDEFWNKDGVSSILVHTQKGNDLICSLTDVELFETTFERIVEKNPNIIRPRGERKETEKFEKLLTKKGLFYAVKHSKKLKTRIKGLVKQIVKRA